MDILHAVVAVQLVSTLVLVGIIWTVQLVHYPLMALVAHDRFVAYEAAHAPRMAAVVLAPWTLEGLTTAWLLLDRPTTVSAALVWSGAVAALVPVLVTILWSVPAHSRLSTGFDAGVHARLIRTNWLRTAGWTAHALIAIAIAVQTLLG
jgi:hypothetical protein